jgi:hypothetical protein
MYMFAKPESVCMKNKKRAKQGINNTNGRGKLQSHSLYPNANKS